jgi:hypothetical protein
MKFFDREHNDDYKARLDHINDNYGENTADAIDYAVDILENPNRIDIRNFQLAVLFDLPLPRIGAADELIAHLQSLMGPEHLRYLQSQKEVTGTEADS